MHVRKNCYIGVAPVPQDLTNVCLVRPSQPADDDLRDPSTLLTRTLAADPLLCDRFAAARMATKPVVLGPLAVDVAQASLDGLILAGDAAGFIDPMTGDGLRFAVRGGELAGLVTLAAFGGRLARPHAQLRRLRRREFAAKWQFNRAVRRIVDRGVAVELAGVAAFAAPWLLSRAALYAGDQP